MNGTGNLLYYGDNLPVLREHIKDESVDLIYLDPPFKSNQDYNVLFREHDATKSVAQIKAFKDTWRWDIPAVESFQEAVDRGGRVSEAMQALRKILGTSDMLAYLSMMSLRLVELHRVLKPEGTIYLHCDPAASHYLKLLIDSIFGPKRFLNEIIWKRTHAHGSSKRYGPIHDTLLFYSKADKYIWTDPRGPHDPKYVADHFKKVDEGTDRNFQPITLTGSGIRLEFYSFGSHTLTLRGYGCVPVRRGRLDFPWFCAGASCDQLAVATYSRNHASFSCECALEPLSL